MSIIKTENCPICNNPTNALEKTMAKYNGKNICKNCATALNNHGVLLTSIKNKDIKELQDICMDVANIENEKQIKGGIIMPQYVVLQVVLKEKFIGMGSGNLSQLENVINTQASKGYRLHTISTTSSDSKGFMGGDRIQATLVFEKL